MSMLRVRWCVILVSLAGWGTWSRAQEPESADALLARAYDTLAALPNLEVTVNVRNLHATPSRGLPAGRSDEFRLLSSDYQQVKLTRRQPEDWRIVSVRERDANGQVVPERKLVFAQVAGGDAAALVLNTTTQEPVRMPIPAGLFRQEVLERAGAALRSDPVLGALFFNRADTGAKAFGLEGAARAGSEVDKGVTLARLTAQRRGDRMTVWVDESTGLITRVLAVPSGPVVGIRRLTEAVYIYDLTRGAEASDFDLEAGWTAIPGGIAASAGFAPAAEVFALTGSPGVSEPSSPGLRPDGRTTAPGVPGAPVSGGSPTVAAAPVAPAGPTPSAPAPEEQLLTPKQMEAIVLVEGDGGVGSGFVARIRDVDFVVTNQHVIGGNEKIRVTTVRGVPVRIGAIFGAVGRDIAILRIEGENTVPALKIVDDPVQTVKFGDKVVVVGNRRGGGVATQVSGVVRGIGPDKIEVDAPFQPGNSGSPIVHVATGDVIGLATYSLTRRLDALDGPAGASAAKAGEKPATEQRWFGHRADGVAKWESIDLAKWRVQAKRVADFAAESEAIYYAMNGRFKESSSSVRVRQLTDRLDERVNRLGSSQAIVMQEVQEFFRSLRALSESGVKELKTGEYYDYFRTSLYWEASITEQLRAREDLARRLDRASENTAAFLAKLRR